MAQEEPPVCFVVLLGSTLSMISSVLCPLLSLAVYISIVVAVEWEGREDDAADFETLVTENNEQIWDALFCRDVVVW